MVFPKGLPAPWRQPRPQPRGAQLGLSSPDPALSWIPLPSPPCSGEGRRVGLRPGRLIAEVPLLLLTLFPH